MFSKYSELIKQWNGSTIDLCNNLYQLLEKEKKEDRSTLFQFVCTNIVLPKEKDEKDSVLFEKSEIGTYKTIYGRFIDGTINGVAKAAYLHDYTIEKEYELLWNAVFENSVLETEKEKAFALYWIVIDAMLPYQSLSTGIRMDNDFYAKKIKKLSAKINKIKYILGFPFEQKTEEASLIVNEITSTRNPDDKAVLLSIALDEHTRQATYRLRKELRELKESSDLTHIPPCK